MESQGARNKAKLLGKLTWFKKRSSHHHIFILNASNTENVHN